jgi:hypothetical protein
MDAKPNPIARRATVVAANREVEGLNKFAYEQALGEWRAACACAQRQSLPSDRLAADHLISSQGISSQGISSQGVSSQGGRHSLWWLALMGAANQDHQHTAVRTALIFVQVLSPSSASRDDRDVYRRAVF